MQTRPRIVVAIGALAVAAAALAGCFSLGVVPPPPGLAPVDPAAMRSGSAFDAAAIADVESDWGARGDWILVRASLNDAPQWFILDTGASASTITGQAAERAGLPAAGAAKVWGETTTTVFRADRVEVGPLELTGLHMAGINMSHGGAAFGTQPAGILGREVFRDAVVELSGPERAVRIHDPARFEEPGGVVWHPIEMHKGLPHVRCTYPGAGEGVEESGLFILDTGSDSGVHFFAHAVARADLLSAEGVRITGRQTQVTFGTRERISTGEVEGLTIGGIELGPVEASFAESAEGASARLPDADGLIGMPLLRQYRVFIDEPRGRMAILPAPVERR